MDQEARLASQPPVPSREILFAAATASTGLFVVVALFLVARAGIAAPWYAVFAMLGVVSLGATAAAVRAAARTLAGPAAGQPRHSLLSEQAAAVQAMDEATGLYRRWYFDLRLQEEVRRSRRYGIPVAVLVINPAGLSLDDFHDGRWHQVAADFAGFAATAASNIRMVDLATALRPTEIAVCLMHCDREGAHRVMLRLAERLGRVRFGIAVFPDDDCDAPEIVALARRRSAMVSADRLAESA